MTLSTLRGATVLSRDCCADFGRPLTKSGCHKTIADKHFASHGGVESPLSVISVDFSGNGKQKRGS